jgi:hypothetical protein
MATTLNPYDYANIFTTYVNDEGFEFYNLSNTVNIDGEIDPSLYTMDSVYTFSDWYALSYKYYGTTRLWWMILVANKITNPFDIQSGQRIKVLKKEVVSEVLSQINNR